MDSASSVASNGANGARGQAVELWRHPAPETSQMWDFLQRVNKERRLHIKTYDELHKWSVDNVADFWAAVWDYVGIVSSAPYEEVLAKDAPMFPRPAFFRGAQLNFAENLLYPPQAPDPDSPAIIAATETTRETVSWADLRERVRLCQSGMLAANVKVGDRVAGFVANHTNALVAMLAATSLGAIWTAVSPDTGVTAVLDRMVQIEPVMLFCDNAVIYNAKTHPTLAKVEEICHSLPSLNAIVLFKTVPEMESRIQSAKLADKVCLFDDFCSRQSPPEKTIFRQLQPDHPVYILYSSGTTGAPKCIVHGAIGTLIQHKKEHILQCDMTPSSTLFYFTTVSWMMWHWLVSGLASGVTVVLYDGSPFRYVSSTGESIPDDLAMPRLIDEVEITNFGTSAKYLSVLEQKAIMPKAHGLSLSTLKAIYSTGSPLAPSTFEYVYKAFGPINLGSITGGTDIISLFGAPCPLTPVYVGEIQTLGLGMSVRAYDYTGTDITSSDQPGDLVCTVPFPCQPVQFWGPTGQSKYKSSYFEMFPNIWHHGDFIRFNPQTGGLHMLGRSDGILKPSGVRFGSAEIYNLLLKHFADDVEDALCIGMRREQDVDETVVLFLKLKDDDDGSGSGSGTHPSRQQTTLDANLVARVKQTVRTELSARHVPGIVDRTPEIPVTTNGKKVEAAVKQILCGFNVKTSASVANAACLDWYREWASKRA